MGETSVSHSASSAQPRRPYSYPVPRSGSAVSSATGSGVKKIRLKMEASKLPKPKRKSKKA